MYDSRLFWGRLSIVCPDAKHGFVGVGEAVIVVWSWPSGSKGLECIFVMLAGDFFSIKYPAIPILD